ncbi:MAG: hypothetical protein P1U68_17260 [Verrucomicrobiales bacterium]|nr:hypothetical protein [Verrucomicrobiales bacterium]
MANLFAVLGLAETLLLKPEDVDSAWQSFARESPASSDSGDGSDLHRARSVLSDPVLLLEHWLDIHGVALERGSSMAPDFMDLFSMIHSALEQADSVYKRHQIATTALAKALLSKEAIAAQLAVQGCLGEIHGKKQERIEQFESFEEAAKDNNYHAAATALGQLKFLKKWEQQCQERLLQLIEC